MQPKVTAGREDGAAKRREQEINGAERGAGKNKDGAIEHSVAGPAAAAANANVDYVTSRHNEARTMPQAISKSRKSVNNLHSFCLCYLYFLVSLAYLSLHLFLSFMASLMPKNTQDRLLVLFDEKVMFMEYDVISILFYFIFLPFLSLIWP